MKNYVKILAVSAVALSLRACNVATIAPLAGTALGGAGGGGAGGGVFLNFLGFYSNVTFLLIYFSFNNMNLFISNQYLYLLILKPLRT